MTSAADQSRDSHKKENKKFFLFRHICGKDTMDFKRALFFAVCTFLFFLLGGLWYVDDDPTYRYQRNRIDQQAMLINEYKKCYKATKDRPTCYVGVYHKAKCKSQ